jgi:Kef-type K+ transport system membrane component KefB
VGELLGGIIIGASVLGLVRDTELLHSFAQIGAILLLFEIGVSSNLYEFLKVGAWAFIVAVVGVVCPFVFGYFLSLALGLDSVHAVFVGATLTATSVGITARVFSDLKKLNSKEAQIVLGAAVIDDVIGLIILAVVTRLVLSGTISLGSIGSITLIAVLFLAGSLAIGAFFAPYLVKLLKNMQVRGMIIAVAFAFCLIMSFFSEKIGLAPIVGAFAAGLILSITDSKTHLEEQLKPISDVFVPIFFVLMGALVDIRVFNPFIQANQLILTIAAALLVAAIVGKVLAGFVVFQKGINKLLIGVGMIPRGEVGLIFASLGLTKGIINAPLYSALVVVVMATTFITPFLLKVLLKKE